MQIGLDVKQIFSSWHRAGVLVVDEMQKMRKINDIIKQTKYGYCMANIDHFITCRRDSNKTHY